MLLSSSLAHLVPGGTAATRVRIAYDHQGFWPVRKSSSVLCTQGAPVSLSKVLLDREIVTVHHQSIADNQASAFHGGRRWRPQRSKLLQPENQMCGQSAYHLSRKTMSLLMSACARARDCRDTCVIKSLLKVFEPMPLLSSDRLFPTLCPGRQHCVLAQLKH